MRRGCQAARFPIARFPIFPLPNLQRVRWLLAQYRRNAHPMKGDVKEKSFSPPL